MAKTNEEQKLPEASGGFNQDQLRAIKENLPLAPAETETPAEITVTPEIKIPTSEAAEAVAPEVTPEQPKQIEDEATRVSQSITTETDAAIAEQPSPDVTPTETKAANLQNNTVNIESLAKKTDTEIKEVAAGTTDDLVKKIEDIDEEVLTKSIMSDKPGRDQILEGQPTEGETGGNKLPAPENLPVGEPAETPASEPTPETSPKPAAEQEKIADLIGKIQKRSQKYDELIANVKDSIAPDKLQSMEYWKNKYAVRLKAVAQEIKNPESSLSKEAIIFELENILIMMEKDLDNYQDGSIIEQWQKEFKSQPAESSTTPVIKKSEEGEHDVKEWQPPDFQKVEIQQTLEQMAQAEDQDTLNVLAKKFIQLSAAAGETDPMVLAEKIAAASEAAQKRIADRIIAEQAAEEAAKETEKQKGKKITLKESERVEKGQKANKTEEELRQAEADETAKRMREDEEKVIRAHEAEQNEDFRGILHPEGPQLGPASMETPKPTDETDAAYRQWGGNLMGKPMEEVAAGEAGTEAEATRSKKETKKKASKKEAGEPTSESSQPEKEPAPPEFEKLREEIDKEEKKQEKTKEKAPKKEREPKIEATDADFVEFTTRKNIFSRFIKNKLERLNNWGDRILGYETGGVKGAKYDLTSRIFTRFKNFFDNKLFGHRNKKAMKFEQYTNDANQELAEQQAVVDSYTSVRDDVSRPWKERAKAQKQLFKAQKKLGKIKSERGEYITKLQKMEGLKEACHNRIVERSQDVANAVKERIDPYQERLDSAKLVIRDLREKMDQAGGELVDWQGKLDDLKLKYTSVPRAQRPGLKAAMADIKGEIKRRQLIMRETKKKIHTCSDKMNHLESLINPWSDLAGAYEDVTGRPVYWSEMRKGMFGDKTAPEPSERSWTSRGVEFNTSEDQLEMPADTEKITPQDYFKKYIKYLYLDDLRHLSSKDLSEIAKKNLTGQVDLGRFEKSIVDFYVKNGVAKKSIKQRLATIRAMMAKKK